MPTSSEGGPASRGGRWAAFVALVAAVFVCANALVCWLVEPYGTSTQVTWGTYYQAADDDIDTVFVGSSTSMVAFDPNVFDEAIGASSFNLGTSGQILRDSLSAARAAIRDHDVRRVVLGVSMPTILNEENPESATTFFQAKAQGEDLAGVLADAWNLYGDPAFASTSSSLRTLFPWTYSRVTTLRDVAANVERRLTCANVVEAAALYEPDWTYEGKGFYRMAFEYDPDANPNNDAALGAEAAVPRDDNMGMLAELCDLCEERGVEFYVVALPTPDVTVLSYGDGWAAAMTEVSELCSAHGATFWDCSMLTPDELDLEYHDWLDTEHLNVTGSAAFSEVLARLVEGREAGEDVSSFFYSMDEFAALAAYRADHDHICTAHLDAFVADGELRCEASVIAGDVEGVEYEYALRAADGSWEVVRPFDAEATCLVPLEGHGEVTVRVTARAATGDGTERFAQQTLTY